MRTILQATLLVILVKFAASPQSPFPAYIAVGFQGLMGALLYRLIPSFTAASLLFGIVAMLESAFQKLLFMTLIFGKSVWEALDKFFEAVLKDFALPADFSFSYWLIMAYAALYALWGLLLGIWIARLPKKIQAKAAEVSTAFYQMNETGVEHITVAGKKKGRNKLVSVFIVMAIIVVIFLWGDEKNAEKAWYVVLRTLSALLLLFGIVIPLFNRALQGWLAKGSSKHKEALQTILDLQPELKRMVKPAYRMASANHKGLRRYSRFLFILIVITLYPIYEPAQDIHTYPGR